MTIRNASHDLGQWSGGMSCAPRRSITYAPILPVRSIWRCAWPPRWVLCALTIVPWLEIVQKHFIEPGRHSPTSEKVQREVDHRSRKYLSVESCRKRSAGSRTLHCANGGVSSEHHEPPCAAGRAKCRKHHAVRPAVVSDCDIYPIGMFHH